MQDGRGDRVKQRLGERYGMERVLLERDLVVLHGQRSATVYGCRRILSFSPCRVLLRVGKKEICVQGEGLCCTCFSGGSVTVQGRITGVLYGAPGFFDGKESR